MKLDKLVVQKARAAELHKAYKEHRGIQTPMDREIESVYRHIAAGKVVIRAIASIVQAGLGDDGRPLLALARADARWCWWHAQVNGGGEFRSTDNWRREAASKYARIPADSFPKIEWEEVGKRNGKAMVPLIPVYLRPKAKLSNYHILFEAEWQNVPPKDPVLLRRIVGDSWLVLAAWDLTPVEMAAMANRINA